MESGNRFKRRARAFTVDINDRALVTTLAMAPIAFNSDNPGLEIMGPMAAIIIGGLVSSTLLNLLLLPLMLLKYGTFKTTH
jgi:Cu/Ag efflux pump CusA